MGESSGSRYVGRALLFERLVDDPEALFGEPSRFLPEPRRVHDTEGLRNSVMRELQALLNTRCAFSSVALGGRLRTAIDYGVPAVEPRGEEGGERYLVRVVRQAVEAYEPRLRNVDVELLGPVAVETRGPRDGGPAPIPGEVLVRITGVLVVEDVREPVSFDVPVQTGGGRIGGPNAR